MHHQQTVCHLAFAAVRWPIDDLPHDPHRGRTAAIVVDPVLGSKTTGAEISQFVDRHTDAVILLPAVDHEEVDEFIIEANCSARVTGSRSGIVETSLPSFEQERKAAIYPGVGFAPICALHSPAIVA